MKRKTPPLHSPASPAVDLVNQGQHQWESGRWREAIETYKQLVKLEPNGSWQTSLASSYEKRAEELAGKQMFKEALILLDNAQRLVNKPDYLPLRLTCLVASGRSQQVVQLFLQEENHIKSAMPDIFPILQEYAAVLLLVNLETEKSLPADSSWRGQLAIARQALATVASNPAEMDTLLGRISLRSPFKPLRVILKALLLSPQQPDKASQLVAAIPPTSPWSVLSRLVPLCSLEWEEVLRRAGEFTNQELELVASWRGISVSQWRKARELLAAPPSRLLTLLLDPTARWPISEGQIRRLAWLSLVDAPSGLAQFERRFGVLDATEKGRLIALGRAQKSFTENFRAWEKYSRQLQELPASAERDKRLAMTLRHLALQVTEADKEDPHIVTLLEESLIYDPNHRQSYASLISWYKNDGDDKSCRQVLDRALQKFSKDAEFLHEAVRLSLANNAFKKAATLAKRLLAIDPLHARVRQDLVGACLSHARKQIRGGRWDLATKELAEATNWQRSEERDGLITLNQAFVAWLSQRQEEGDALFEQGIREAGEGVAAHLLANLEGLRISLPSRWSVRLIQNLQASSREAASRESILALVQVAMGYKDEDSLKKLVTHLATLLTNAISLDYSSKELRSLCHFLAETRMYALLARYAATGNKKWREQAAFDYYRLLAKYRGMKETIARTDRRRLKLLLKKAEEDRDHELSEYIQEWLWMSSPWEEHFSTNMPTNPAEVREIVLEMLVPITRELLDELDSSTPRSNARTILLDMFDSDVIPADFRKMVGDRDELIEEILNVAMTGRKTPSKPARGPQPKQMHLNLEDIE